MSTVLRRLLLPTVVVVALSASVTPAYAAAPRFILVYGGRLAEPGILDDWYENLALLTSATEEASLDWRGLHGRPFYRLAMFWGGQWEGTEPHALSSDHADQGGRYYPRHGKEGPLFTF